jgi:hypothetical protein
MLYKLDSYLYSSVIIPPVHGYYEQDLVIAETRIRTGCLPVVQKRQLNGKSSIVAT